MGLGKRELSFKSTVRVLSFVSKFNPAASWRLGVHCESKGKLNKILLIR
jgi:hypothetical protein